MKNKIEVLEYRLPDYLGCYLINGDIDSITDEERAEIDAFIEREKVSFVGMNDDSSFYHRNDLNSMGADCSTFIAHKHDN